MRKLGYLALIVSSSCLASADDFSGRNSFPHFRDLSALPGGSFGVRPDGVPGVDGALALSSPIAYSLGARRFVFGLASRSTNLRPEFLNFAKRSDQFSSDGTGQILGGFSTPIGRFTVSTTILSTVLDNVGNVHWQLPLKSEKLGVAIGAQNATGRPGQADVESAVFSGENSRSYYVVATYALPYGTYLTLGKGDTRFQGLFGSASVPIGSRARLMVEGERFGWNTGISYQLTEGPADLRRPSVSVFAGVVRGQRTVIALNVAL